MLKLKLTNVSLLKMFSFLFLNLNLFLNLSCNTTEPPPPDETKPTLTLELDDAHCTEAWLQLTTKDLELPAELILKQYHPTGDSLSQIFLLNTKDSLLHIDSLSPNQNYKFKVAVNTTNCPQPTTNVLTVTTMDTTNHNFTFETVIFGGAIGSSVLYDVAIINENNIWAVGEIWIADTSQLGYTKYNAVHWDGNSWELKQLMWNNSVFSPIRGILIIDENNYYFAAGSVFKWNGSSTNVQLVFSRLSLPEPNGTIEKLWGESGTNIYGVGNVGNLVHYNGASWQRIESGTTLNINDIWGDYDEKTNEWEILAVAGNILQGTESERAILQIKNNLSSELLNAEGTGWPLSGIWFNSGRKYYLVGSGVFSKTLLNESLWDSSLISISEYHTNAIRANNINDAFIVGAFGESLHFNGVGWKSYQNDLGVFFGSYKAISVKNDLVISVGYESTKAKILVGRR